jgi:hypothetical protein
MLLGISGIGQRLNIELDLQSLFGLHVQLYTASLAERPQSPPPAFGLENEGAIGRTSTDNISLLTNSALVYEPRCVGGGGELRGLSCTRDFEIKLHI